MQGHPILLLGLCLKINAQADYVTKPKLISKTYVKLRLHKVFLHLRSPGLPCDSKSLPSITLTDYIRHTSYYDFKLVNYVSLYL